MRVLNMMQMARICTLSCVMYILEPCHKCAETPLMVCHAAAKTNHKSSNMDDKMTCIILHFRQPDSATYTPMREACADSHAKDSCTTDFMVKID